MIQRMEHWGNTHHPKWVDILRICLGAFIMVKAVQFIQSMSAMSAVLDKYQSHFIMDFSLGVTRYYTLFAHIVGGYMILFGLQTRFWCLLQIPILILALVFYHSPLMVMSPDGIWWISVVALLLCVFFVVEGGGPWSADRLLKDNPERLVR